MGTNPVSSNQSYLRKGFAPETLTQTVIYLSRNWHHPHLLITPHRLYERFYNASVHVYNGISISIFHVKHKSKINLIITVLKIKVKWSRYRPGVAQRVGRGIALLFHDRGTRRGWVVSSTPRLHFTPGKDSVRTLQEVGWAPGPVWTGGKSRPHRGSIPDRPARSQSLYRLSCPPHNYSTNN